MAQLMKGIKWKDINQEFKNDFDKTLAYIESSLSEQEKETLTSYVQQIDAEIAKLDLALLGSKTKPPEGY